MHLVMDGDDLDARGLIVAHLRYIMPPVPTLPTVKFLPSFNVVRISGPDSAALDLVVRSRITSLLFLTRRRVLLFLALALFPWLIALVLEPFRSALDGCPLGPFGVPVGWRKDNFPPFATTIWLTTAGSMESTDFSLGEEERVAMLCSTIGVDKVSDGNALHR